MGNNLKTIRSNSGKTQKQVAMELGISLSAYRKYEQGTRRLTDEQLADSADTMNRSGKYKSFGNIPKSNAPASSHGRATTA